MVIVTSASGNPARGQPDSDSDTMTQVQQENTALRLVAESPGEDWWRRAQRASKVGRESDAALFRRCALIAAPGGVDLSTAQTFTNGAVVTYAGLQWVVVNTRHDSVDISRPRETPGGDRFISRVPMTSCTVED